MTTTIKKNLIIKINNHGKLLIEAKVDVFEMRLGCLKLKQINRFSKECKFLCRFNCRNCRRMNRKEIRQNPVSKVGH